MIKIEIQLSRKLQEDIINQIKNGYINKVNGKFLFNLSMWTCLPGYCFDPSVVVRVL